MSGNAARQQSPLIRIMIAIFIVLLAVWIVLKIYIARTEPSVPPPDGTRVSIVATAGLKGYREPCGWKKDVYSGMARWAALIDKRRTRHPVILVDAGGFCNPNRSGSAVFDLEYFFEGMKLMGYAAAGVGADDIMCGRERLLEYADEAKLTLLSTNLIDRRNGRTLGKKYRIVRAGEVRIGIFSVILPLFVHEIDPSTPLSYEVIDPRIAALEAVSVLREKGCDLIVALSYMGWKGSRELAGSVDGIDVVINGKREHNRPTGEMVGNTLVVDTGVRRITLTEVRVEWEGGSPSMRVFEAGGEAKALEGRKDLLELERKYLDELRARGIEDIREGR